MTDKEKLDAGFRPYHAVVVWAKQATENGAIVQDAGSISLTSNYKTGDYLTTNQFTHKVDAVIRKEQFEATYIPSIWSRG